MHNIVRRRRRSNQASHVCSSTLFDASTCRRHTDKMAHGTGAIELFNTTTIVAVCFIAVTFTHSLLALFNRLHTCTYKCIHAMAILAIDFVCGTTNTTTRFYHFNCFFSDLLHKMSVWSVFVCECRPPSMYLSIEGAQHDKCLHECGELNEKKNKNSQKSYLRARTCSVWYIRYHGVCMTIYITSQRI